LASRVPDIEAVGLEIDPSLTSLASENFHANQFAGLTAITQDLLAWSTDSVYDHAFANPPWYPITATESPDPAKKLAKQAGDDLIIKWSMALAARVRRGGTVSLILPAARLADGINGLVRAKCPEVTVSPLWPRQGQAAKLVILRGVRLGKGGCRLVAGLTLHQSGSTYTEAAKLSLDKGGRLAAEENCAAPTVLPRGD
jgi:tRNA1(Val) A37 N6-methylase TrmN6